MKKNKKIIIPVIALSILMGVGAYGVGSIYASEDNSLKNSLIEKIAQKFNLNKDDVQKVFDEDREEKKTQMEEKFNQMLDEAVSNGDLTAEQKSLILAKREEMQKERETQMSERKNDGERPSKEEMETMQEERKTEREALEKWASDNGIDLKYLMGLGGFGRGGHGGFGGPGERIDSDDSK
ncbi:MAG: hypothetical protein RBR97_16590 [Bacteroidales bacterium]|jgi:hypothetical protein|nr:hypothetical protein [Bacteroidales bacterium]